MKCSRLAMLLVIMTMPLASFAQNQEPDQFPDRQEGASAAPSSRPDRDDLPEQRERRGLMGLGGGRTPREISEQEWDAARVFFEKHSPNYMAALQGFEPSRRHRFRPKLVTRYDTIKGFEKTNPELYAIKVRQLELEDNIFALKRKHSEATAKSPEAQKLREELRTVVTELVKSRVQERKARISRIEKLLAEEQKKLAEDERRQEQMVNKQVDAFLRDDDATLNPRDLREPAGANRRDRELEVQ